MKLTQGKIKSHGKTLEIASSAVISYSQAKTHREALVLQSQPLGY
jgi:hypothetical protein